MYIPYIYPERDTFVTTKFEDLQERLCVADLPRIALDFPYMTLKEAERLEFDPKILANKLVYPRIIEKAAETFRE